MSEEKIGLDIFDDAPDYSKSKEENDKIYREKYFKIYGEYPPSPEGEKAT